MNALFFLDLSLLQLLALAQRVVMQSTLSISGVEAET